MESRSGRLRGSNKKDRGQPLFFFCPVFDYVHGLSVSDFSRRWVVKLGALFYSCRSKTVYRPSRQMLEKRLNR